MPQKDGDVNSTPLELPPKRASSQLMSGGEGQRVAGRWRPRTPILQKGVEVTRGRFEALDICPVELDVDEGNVVSSVCGVKAEITVDSAADESVCPRAWADHFGTRPVEQGKELRLINASGGKINHYGSRKVAFHPDAADGRMLGVGFEVIDVKKPLMAVSRICEKGNVVQFGPEPKHNFIQNIANGEKLYMKRRGNSYVLQGELAASNPF